MNRIRRRAPARPLDRPTKGNVGRSARGYQGVRRFPFRSDDGTRLPATRSCQLPHPDLDGNALISSFISLNGPDESGESRKIIVCLRRKGGAGSSAPDPLAG